MKPNKIVTAEAGGAGLPTRQEMLQRLAAGKPVEPVAAAVLGEPAPAPAAPASPTPAQLAAAAPVQDISAGVDVERLAQHVADLIDKAQAGRPERFSKYSDIKEFMLNGVRAGDLDAIAAFALATQVTGNNNGVILPTFLTDLKRVVDRGHRAITALGGPRSIPDSGLTITYPYSTIDVATLVGTQANQLDEVTSVRVDILQGSKNLGTYAGGSRLSWQLMERSDPAYISLYLRIMGIGYAWKIDDVFVTELETTTAAVDVAGGLHAGGIDADAVRAAVFAASAMVDDATGAPATVLLCAPNVFDSFGSAAKKGLVQPQWSPQNVPGTADASTLTVNIAGIPAVRVPGLTAGQAIATNDLACGWHGTAPMFADQDQVSILGTDAVIWGMGAGVMYAPAGVVKIYDAP